MYVLCRLSSCSVVSLTSLVLAHSSLSPLSSWLSLSLCFSTLSCGLVVRVFVVVLCCAVLVGVVCVCPWVLFLFFVFAEEQPPCVDSKRLRVYIQNDVGVVPEHTRTFRMYTRRRFESTHGGCSACHTTPHHTTHQHTHTTPHHTTHHTPHHHTTHHTHTNTPHHTPHTTPHHTPTNTTPTPTPKSMNDTIRLHPSHPPPLRVVSFCCLSSHLVVTLRG